MREKVGEVLCEPGKGADPECGEQCRAAPRGLVGTRLHVVGFIFPASWPRQQQQREVVSNLKWALKNWGNIMFWGSFFRPHAALS